MKSYIERCSYNDTVFPSDSELYKLVLDFGELMHALRNNAVVSLIENLLHPRFGNSEYYYPALHSITMSALSRLACTLESGENPQQRNLCVVFCDKQFNKGELLSSYTPNTPYWVGEDTPINYGTVHYTAGFCLSSLASFAKSPLPTSEDVFGNESQKSSDVPVVKQESWRDRPSLL